MLQISNLKPLNKNTLPTQAIPHMESAVRWMIQMIHGRWFLAEAVVYLGSEKWRKGIDIDIYRFGIHQDFNMMMTQLQHESVDALRFSSIPWIFLHVLRGRTYGKARDYTVFQSWSALQLDPYC